MNAATAIIAAAPDASRVQEDAKPYWQTTPCPSWCEGRPGASEHLRHQDRDTGDDRLHSGIYHTVDLAIEDPDVELGPDIPGEPREITAHPSFISMRLEQGYREAEPRIGGPHGDQHEITFTLDEAEEFAGVLFELVREGRAST